MSGLASKWPYVTLPYDSTSPVFGLKVTLQSLAVVEQSNEKSREKNCETDGIASDLSIKRNKES